jgi:hypothetical protein
MKNFKILFFIGLFAFSNCKKFKQTTDLKTPLINIELARDTVFIQQYVKGLIVLKNPYFMDVESKIIVVFEDDENFPLMEDLSNELEIPIVAFHNLTFDVENQQWFPEYDFNKSVAFGKKFNTTGSKKLRGFVLEYITDDPPSLDTIIIDNKHKKHFFEKSIYIKDTND